MPCKVLFELYLYFHRILSFNVLESETLVDSGSVSFELKARGWLPLCNGVLFPYAGMSSMAPLLFGVLRELGTLRLLSFWSVTGRT